MNFINTLKKSFILFIAAVSAFGMDIKDLTKEDLAKEGGRDYLAFTFLGSSAINRTAFENVYNDTPKVEKRYFEVKDTFEKLKAYENAVKKAEDGLISSIARIEPIESMKLSDSEILSLVLENKACNEKLLKLEQEKLKHTRNIISAGGEVITNQELDQKKLSYFHKQIGNELSVLYSGQFSIADNKYEKKGTLDYANLIADAFSIDKMVDRLSIYAHLEARMTVRGTYSLCK